MSIETIVKAVCNANLLIRRDVAPEKVGSIHLASSTRSNLRTTAGTVLGVGPAVQADIQVGSRVLFSEFAGSVVALEGIESRSDIIFLADLDVFAVLSDDDGSRLEGDSEGEDSSLGLPLSWMARCRARPPYMLVERAEIPLTRGKLFLPPGSRQHTRATEVVVRDVGASVRGYAPGDRLQLASQAGRDLAFGVRGERKLTQISPSSVFAVYREAPEDVVLVTQGARNVPVDMLEELREAVYSEGDVRGLR